MTPTLKWVKICPPWKGALHLPLTENCCVKLMDVDKLNEMSNTFKKNKKRLKNECNYC